MQNERQRYLESIRHDVRTGVRPARLTDSEHVEISAMLLDHPGNAAGDWVLDRDLLRDERGFVVFTANGVPFSRKKLYRSPSAIKHMRRVSAYRTAVERVVAKFQRTGGNHAGQEAVHVDPTFAELVTTFEAEHGVPKVRHRDGAWHLPAAKKTQWNAWHRDRAVLKMVPTSEYGRKADRKNRVRRRKGKAHVGAMARRRRMMRHSATGV